MIDSTKWSFLPLVFGWKDNCNGIIDFDYITAKIEHNWNDEIIEYSLYIVSSFISGFIIVILFFRVLYICHDNYQTLIVANKETENWKHTSFEYFVQSKILRCSYVRLWKISLLRFLSIMKMNVNHCHWIYFSFFI